MVDRSAELYSRVMHIGNTYDALAARLRENEPDAVERKLAKEEKRKYNGPRFSAANHADIIRYLDHLESINIKPTTKLRRANSLRFLAALVNKDFKDMTREDIQALVKVVREKSTNPSKYLEELRAFVTFIKGVDEPPSEVKWIKPEKKEKLIDPEDLLTPAEAAAVRDAALNTRDKAFLAVLYDSEGRIGEVLTLQLERVHDKGAFYDVRVNGKTGPRPITLVDSAPYLREWLKVHPTRENPESPLFVKIQGKPDLLRYGAARKMIIEAAARAGVKKAINPHAWRKARATELSESLTEAVHSQRAGWVIGSREPGKYIRLKDTAQRSAMLKLAGQQADDAVTRKQALQSIAELVLNEPAAFKAGVESIARDESKMRYLMSLFALLGFKPDHVGNFANLSSGVTGHGGKKQMLRHKRPKSAN